MSAARGNDDGAALRQKAISGGGWTLAGNLFRQVLQFGFSIVLARLLVPEDFGLLAMVLVFCNFARIFLDLGVSPAIIQRRELDDGFYHTAFTLHVLMGGALTVALFVAAPLLAALYEQPRLTDLARVVSLQFVLASLSAAPKARLQRDLGFRALALTLLAATLAANVVGCVAAVYNCGPYSLAYALLTEYGVVALILWAGPVPRPRPAIHRRCLRELAGFGSHMSLIAVLRVLVREADKLVIGKAFSGYALGLYNRAYMIMLMPVNEVSKVIMRVLFPVMSKAQDDRAMLKGMLLQSVGMIAFVTFPCLFGLWAVAGDFVIAVYGSKWDLTVELIQILCLVGALEATAQPARSMLISLGRTRRALALALFSAVVAVVAFALGVLTGDIYRFAMVYLAAVLLLHVVRLAYAGGAIRMSYLDAARAFGGPGLCAVAMAGLTWGLGHGLPATWPPAARLACCLPFGVCVYAVLVHAFGLQPYRDARRILAARLGPQKNGAD